MSQESFFFFLIYAIFFALIVSFVIIIIKLFFNLIKAIFRKLFSQKKKNIEKEEQKEQEEIVDLEKHKVANIDLSRPINKGENKEEKFVKTEAEQNEKEITEQLNKLKKDSSDEKETIESKMPSMGGKEQDSGGDHQKIKIPRAKDFSIQQEKDASDVDIKEKNIKKSETEQGEKEVTEQLNELKSVSGEYSIKDTDNFEKTRVADNHGIIRTSDVLAKEKTLRSGYGKESQKTEEIPLYEKPDILKDNLISHSQKTPMQAVQEKQNNPADNSIFKGKSEVSRTDLRQRLRNDPETLKAQKQVGLNLSPTERAKLEKEVFSQTYGGNISKTDLKWGIKKLNQKMMGAKNPVEKGKIRKEIKFFKKIGGINK